MTRVRKEQPKLRHNHPRLNETQFAHCCGMNILYGFSKYLASEAYWVDETGRGERNQSVFNELLYEYLEYQKCSMSSAQAAANIVALNQKQEEHLSEPLLRAGYVRTMNGAQNGKHNSLIYTYMYVFRPELSGPNLFPGAGAGTELDY